MCGIVGYVGPRDATSVLLGGLRRLEYRGYDSAGIIVGNGGQELELVKAAGRLSHLALLVEQNPIEGNSGIAHTRWATHGRPSDVNAHPHTDCTGKIGLVHNGIVENYLHLKKELEAEGHVFQSETDTEVLPHLIEKYYQGDLAQAVRRALADVQGSYAIAVVHQDEPGVIVAARKDSPLVAGIGEHENLVASDIPALLDYTRKVVILDDGEMARLERDKVDVTDLQGRKVVKQPMLIEWDAAMAEKGGYPDFMLKEIHEQPRAIRDTLAGRLNVAVGGLSRPGAPGPGSSSSAAARRQDHHAICLDEVKLDEDALRRMRKAVLVACGTAYHAGLVGKYLFERLTGLSLEVDVASEFRYRDPYVDENTLALVISQSGETADTLAGLREAKRKGAHVIAITNVVGSSVSREADSVIYTWAGPEIAVASTKAYITQLTALYLVALYIGERRGTLTHEKALELALMVRELPQLVNEVFSLEDEVKALAEGYKDREDIFFIGRGLDYAVAMEGSLKLKEISYIHAEAYPAGELKHGTLALVVEGIPVFALATQRVLFDKMLSNIKEVKARDATVIAIARADDKSIDAVADHVLRIPAVAEDFIAPVLAVVPLQLFAYYAAKARGCDVDKPRNLAKSVTVE